MTEQWKNYPPNPQYEVSSLGRMRKGTRLLSSFIHRDGYVIFGLATPGLRRRDKGGYKQKYIHQMVLETFIGPRPKGLIALHWDDNKLNNAVGNLRWGTYSDNQLDAVRNGTHISVTRPHCKFGHLLLDPNLRRSGTSKQCKACAQATSTICARKRRRGVDDSHLMEEIANERYETIMEDSNVVR